ncbi:glutamyl aminopeptidase-like protein [Leptotrombidium deliense]|uniref:Glutamyl aminopeptidase-like protein n=1 Tax=Leptotrombidium deliense TaxID=299467 RepID=A0A443STJ2_9ACAR|nr:glutamyl aminopeptidase-like protein [Leptotrombidium deliense]
MAKSYIDKPKYVLTITLFVLLLLIAILAVSLIIAKKESEDAENEEFERLIVTESSNASDAHKISEEGLKPNEANKSETANSSSDKKLMDPCSSEEAMYNYSLNDGVKPIRYDLLLSLNADSTHFTGKLSIFVQLERRTKLIALNVGNDMDVNKCRLLSNTSEEMKTLRRPIDRIRQFFIVETNECLSNGVYELYFEFEAKFANKNGVLKKKYFDSKRNETRHAIISNLQTASNAFPCFESFSNDLRAKFQIEIIHEKRFTAVSNSQLKEKEIYSKNLLISKFEETDEAILPSMVAVYVTELECQDLQENEVAIAVCCTSEHIQKSTFALDLSTHFLSYFEDYFGRKCAQRKLHIFGIPGLIDVSFSRGVIAVNEHRLIRDSSWTLIDDEMNTIELISESIFETVFHLI